MRAFGLVMKHSHAIGRVRGGVCRRRTTLTMLWQLLYSVAEDKLGRLYILRCRSVDELSDQRAYQQVDCLRRSDLQEYVLVVGILLTRPGATPHISYLIGLVI
jgi:hypothetical protein